MGEATELTLVVNKNGSLETYSERYFHWLHVPHNIHLSFNNCKYYLTPTLVSYHDKLITSIKTDMLLIKVTPKDPNDVKMFLTECPQPETKY